MLINSLFIKSTSKKYKKPIDKSEKKGIIVYERSKKVKVKKIEINCGLAVRF